MLMNGWNRRVSRFLGSEVLSGTSTSLSDRMELWNPGTLEPFEKKD
jgi:hypothetical protein